MGMNDYCLGERTAAEYCRQDRKRRAAEAVSAPTSHWAVLHFASFGDRNGPATQVFPRSSGGRRVAANARPVRLWKVPILSYWAR